VTIVVKWTPALVAFGILAAACGGGTVTQDSFETSLPTTATVAATDEEAPVTTAGIDPTTTTATTATAAPAVVVDGPPAPDFALALDDGRGFILSEEQRPVYMVFWAEW
jgi:hypothetical protein